MAVVAVLHDRVPEAASKDVEDTRVQVEAVSRALRQLGREPVAVEVGPDLPSTAEALRKARPGLVFNLVESVGGDARRIHEGPGLLDSLGVPYTGAGRIAMFLTSNKLATKRVLESEGIPAPPWATRRLLRSGDVRGSVRWIVKSMWEHASIGMDETAVLSSPGRRGLLQAIEERVARRGGRWFAERFIEGREFNLALLAGEDGPEVLPPGEMLFTNFPEGKPRIVDYRAKWEEGSFEWQNTPRSFEFPRSDRRLLEALSDLALACWECFGLRGYARVDFRVDRKGRPWVLEVNANPCLSPDAGYAAAAQQAGVSYVETIERIVRDAEAVPPDDDDGGR